MPREGQIGTQLNIYLTNHCWLVHSETWQALMDAELHYSDSNLYGKLMNYYGSSQGHIS